VFISKDHPWFLEATLSAGCGNVLDAAMRVFEREFKVYCQVYDTCWDKSFVKVDLGDFDLHHIDLAREAARTHCMMMILQALKELPEDFVRQVFALAAPAAPRTTTAKAVPP
jgi:hypothetical protein